MNSDYEKSAYFCDILHISTATFNNYIKEVKNDDADFYRKNILEKKKPKGGKPIKYYSVSEWLPVLKAIKKFKAEKRVRKPKKKVSNTNKNRIKTETIIKRAKGEIEQNESSELLEKYVFVDFENKRACWAILNSVCETHLTGQYTIKGSVQHCGLRIEQFWQIVALGDRFKDKWQKTHALWLRMYQTEFQALITSRSYEILTKKVKTKRVIKYEFVDTVDAHGQIVQKPKKMHMTEYEEEFIPKGSDLLVAKTMMLDLEKEIRELMPPETEIDLDELNVDEKLELIMQLQEQLRLINEMDEEFTDEVGEDDIDFVQDDFSDLNNE